MEQKTFLTSPVKAILIFTIILLTGLLLVVVGNPLKKSIAPAPIPSTEPRINAIKISADGKSILNSETKVIIFTIADTQKYLVNSGYAYNPDTFQTTKAKYAGDCFLSAALSNEKDKIVFSAGCLPGDLPQAWIGIYNFYNDNCPSKALCRLSPHLFRFLIGGGGRIFNWLADDKIITYEASLGLSGMTESRTINSLTGEIIKLTQ